MYFIESKATYEDSFPFAMLSDFQHSEMLKKSAIIGVKSLVVVLYATYQRAFILDIKDIENQLQSGGPKSLNIKKIDKWTIKYTEIPTVTSRKQLLDYDQSFADYYF